ncbi:hypothetical protein EA831_24435, partial [Vibrio anguillarum]|nr:hypothetical protein [Vibrio anguillarum]
SMNIYCLVMFNLKRFEQGFLIVQYETLFLSYMTRKLILKPFTSVNSTLIFTPDFSKINEK